MKFSLIIPTKDRQYTAEYAIKSALQSNYSDIEIIVSDVSATNKLEAIVNDLGDNRIKYYHHAHKLSMRDNWEFAVSKSSGDYVSVIGDDDALMPDGFLFAKKVIEHLRPPAIKCTCPIYKWPDYPLISRANSIFLKLPTNLLHVNNPRVILEKAYNFKNKIGTGPGIYHGLISRDFLNNNFKRRGRYFVDEIPDLDSGLATLLYADNFIITKYPIFLSGACSASNSGSMRFSALQKKSIDGFSEDLKKTTAEVLLEDFPYLSSNEIAIVSGMRRFLNEIRNYLGDESFQLDLQGAFDYIAEGFGTGYENTSYKSDKKMLQQLAETWSVSSSSIPRKRLLAYGNLSDKGIGASSVGLEPKPIDDFCIDCDDLGVSNILDAVKIVAAATVDWEFMLRQHGLNESSLHTDPDVFHKKNHAIMLINNGKIDEGLSYLRKLVSSHPLDSNLHFLIGAHHFNQKNYGESISHLARSISLQFEINTFRAYFRALVKLEEYSFLEKVCDNYFEDLESISVGLGVHYGAVVDLYANRVHQACEKFSSILDPFDQSLHLFAEAKASFSDGDYERAYDEINKALQLKPSEVDYLELELAIKGKL